MGNAGTGGTRDTGGNKEPSITGTGGTRPSRFSKEMFSDKMLSIKNQPVLLEALKPCQRKLVAKTTWGNSIYICLGSGKKEDAKR